MKILLYMGAMLLLLAAACSEDKGNYNYLPVNTIVEDSIEGTYTVVQFDTLTIKPYLRFSREESEDLSFEWSIEGQVISTDPVCHARIMMEPNDEKDVNNRWYDALLCITDNTTGLKYYKSFRVTVNTAYSVALYMLSEGTDGQARLSFQRRDIPDAPIVHDVFEAANPRLGKLGKKPRQVYTGSIMSKTFVVICEEGDKKMAVLNRTNLKLDKNYNEEVVMGGYSGTFTPYEIKVLMGGMVVAKEGLLGYNYMNSAALYRPIVGDYDFAHWVDCNYTMDDICGFLTIIRANSLCVWKYLRAWLMIKYPPFRPRKIFRRKDKNFWWEGIPDTIVPVPYCTIPLKRKLIFIKS